MSNYSMLVIPKPPKGTPVLKVQTPITGIGNDNYLCGACNNIICKNMSPKQILGVIIICNKCGSYNKKGEN